MTLSQKQVDQYLQKLEDRVNAPDATEQDRQNLVNFRERLKRLKVTPRRTEDERFDVVFRTTGLVRKKELRAEWRASGLSLDAWRDLRNDAKRRVLVARHRLDKLFGRYGYRLSPRGEVSILVERRWMRWGTLDTVVPPGTTPGPADALAEMGATSDSACN